MFAPVRDWQPPASAWAELWEQDDEIVEFEPSFDDVPGAASAALVENVDPAALSDELLIDAMAGWGRVGSVGVVGAGSSVGGDCGVRVKASTGMGG